MKKRSTQKFWSQIKKRDKEEYADSDAIFDWCLLRLIGLYVTLVVAIAFFYSKVLALALIALLFAPCIIILVILLVSKK